MYPVYTVPDGDTLPVLFHTFSSDDPSASVTTTGLAVTDIEIYKDGSATQRASDNGYTLLDTDGIDFDSTTGVHGFSIDTSDNSDAGFYTVGAWFHVVVSSITVDAATINFVACAFRIVAAEGVAGKPSVDATAISSDNTAADNAEAFFDNTGFNASNSTIGTCTTNTDMRGTDNGALASVCTEARLSELDAATAGKMANQVDEIRSDTEDLQTQIGTAGAGLTNIPWNSSWDAEVQSECADALVAIHLDHLFATDYDPASKPGAATALLNELFESDAGVSRFTANALEQGPVATGFSTHSAADVWAVGTRTLTANTNLNDPTAAAVATAVLAEVIEGSFDVTETLRLILAANVGKLSGAATASIAIRDTADTKNRISATVDADGNQIGRAHV